MSGFLTLRAIAKLQIEHQRRLNVLAAHQRIAATIPEFAAEVFGPNSLAMSRIAIEQERRDLESLWPVLAACSVAANDDEA